MDSPAVARTASGGSTGIGLPVDPRVLSCIADLSILGKDIESLSKAVCECLVRVERSRDELSGIASGRGDAGESCNLEVSKQLVTAAPATQQPSNGIDPLRGNLLAQRVKQFIAPQTVGFQGGNVGERLMSSGKKITQIASNCRDRALAARRSAGNNALDRFVSGDLFNIVSILIICVNTIYLGFEADRTLQNNYARLVDLPVDGGFAYLDHTFASLFVVELCLRMLSERVVFFVGPDCVWNVLDFVLVLTSVIELIGDGTHNMSFVRIFRFCRFMRIIRVIRAFRFLLNLRTLLFSILGSLVALSWAFVLMVVLLYVVAMVLVNGVSSYYARQSTHTIEVEEIHKLYTSVISTMLRLFEGITGGISWTDLTRQLDHVGYVYSFVLFSYVFVMFFGILNTVTGIVVDAAIQQAHSDRKEIVREECERQRKYMQELQSIFVDADVDNSCYMSWEEFEAHLASEDVQIIFETMSVGTHELFELFQLLDLTGTNSVGIDEFVGGVMRLKGNARSVDLCHFMASFSSFVNGPFRTLNEDIAELIRDTRTQSQLVRAFVKGEDPPVQAKQFDL